jgi:uncharacterized protein
MIAEAMTLNRRQFLTRSALALASAGVLGYSLSESRDLRCVSHPLSLPGLPPAFAGLRVAVLSDIHHCFYFPLSCVEHVVEQANALKPDVILLLGDYVHRAFPSYIPSVMGALARLSAPMGAYAVLGNHDVQAGRAAISGELRRNGIPELTNCGVWLRRGEQRIRICGVDDRGTGRPNIRAALGDSVAGDTVLMMSHNPDVVETLRDKRASFVFCGHTHGGQIYIPAVGSPVVPSSYGQKYRYGFVQGPSVRTYVTSGVGTMIVPVRLFCRPEIVCFTLSA